MAVTLYYCTLSLSNTSKLSLFTFSKLKLLVTFNILIIWPIYLIKEIDKKKLKSDMFNSWRVLIKKNLFSYSTQSANTNITESASDKRERYMSSKNITFLYLQTQLHNFNFSNIYSHHIGICGDYLKIWLSI